MIVFRRSVMNKIIVGLLLLILVIGIIVFPKRNMGDKLYGKPVVKIGISLPLMGEFSNAGQGLKNAALLAQDDLNGADNKYQYQLIIDNDAFEAKRTLAIFNKFVNSDEVDGVISFASQAGNIMAPIAEQKKILHINFGASDKRVWEGKYNFVHWTAPKTTTRKMLDFYVSKGWKKIVLITAHNAGNLSLEDALLAQLSNYQNMQAKVFHVQPTERDFRMLLAQVKEYNPDVVLSLVYGDAVTPFVKQYRDKAVNKPLTNIEAFSMLADFSLIEGVYIADVAKDKGKLLERLRANDKNASSFGVGNIYDAVMLMGQAFEKAQEKIQAVDELQKIKTYEGMVGTLQQDDDGFFDAHAILEKVVDGRLMIIND